MIVVRAAAKGKNYQEIEATLLHLLGLRKMIAENAKELGKGEIC